MRTKRIVPIGLLVVVLAGTSLVAGVLVGPFGTADREPASPSAMAFSARGARKVQVAYAEWVKEHDAYGGDRNVAIPLGYWKALSEAFTRASGMAKLNLIDGSVSVIVSDLPTDQQWDVWLVDNQPGPRHSMRPEPGDVKIRVGRLAHDGATAKLDAELGGAAFAEFHVDLVVVARAGDDPGTAALLFGAPPLFQRLYTSLRSERLLSRSDFASHAGIVVNRHWTSVFGARPAVAAEFFVNEDVVFNELVRKGAELFIKEKFNGNGRTCESCHRMDGNFTIDVNLIASLRDDDPLFVAEFMPALAFTPSGDKFEVPVLMRGAALIVENVDGMDDLVNKFTMRGVPHTLALRTSLTPAASDANPPNPKQRTGWSGDGAPGTGTLREFATGAVTQHFTRTLNRVPGVDFRLPTDAELDAMEAFQLSLGRQADLVLPLNLKDSRAVRGQELFTLASNAGGGGCNACHANAGANAAFGGGGNRNFNTGVENQPDRPAELISKARNIHLKPSTPERFIPRNGGFGQEPGEGPDGTGFGNGTFNTPPLVEAADTGPFFHDNSVETIEGAVAFYNSQQFADAQGIQRLNLATPQVEAIAAFLRAINALDNIREATETATAGRAVSNSHPRVSDTLRKQAIGDTRDAVGVLAPRGLHPSAVQFLDRAAASFTAAIIVNGPAIRIDRVLIDRGLDFLRRARAEIIN